jgi:hypothetical protein
MILLTFFLLGAACPTVGNVKSAATAIITVLKIDFLTEFIFISPLGYKSFIAHTGFVRTT